MSRLILSKVQSSSLYSVRFSKSVDPNTTNHLPNDIPSVDIPENITSISPQGPFKDTEIQKTIREILERIIRVDQAGEYGAIRIYQGQHCILKNTPSGPIINEMKEQERVHLETFDKLVAKYRVRPTALTPIWHVAGYGMGAFTALLGSEAAMACTVAVEDVIGDHYNEQIATLTDLVQKHPEHQDLITLKDILVRFRDEELEHRDTGIEHNAKQTPLYTPLYSAVSLATKTAIYLSKRI